MNSKLIIIIALACLAFYIVGSSSTYLAINKFGRDSGQRAGKVQKKIKNKKRRR